MNFPNEVDYLIIGGGIAGVTAAETIREKDNSSSITVITNEAHLLYSRVLLPSYLKERIRREQVFMRTVDDFDAKNIHLFLGEEVSAVNPSRHEVVLANGNKVGYRKLLITTGGRVRPFAFQGAEGMQNIFRLQTIDDADLLYHALSQIKSAVVVGGGFISLEFLEILRLKNIHVTFLMRDKRFFSTLVNEEGSTMLEKNFEKHGIEIIREDEIASIGGKGRVEKVMTRGGRAIDCDALCLGIGIQRNTEFLLNSGIAVGNNGISANEFLETSVPDIYAAGDVAEFEDTVLGIRHSVGNWNNAFLQGKAAGRNMAGEKVPFHNLASYSIGNLGMHISAIGDIHPDMVSVSRKSSSAQFFEQFFFKDDEIRGAVIFNMPRHQVLISRWIVEKKNFAGLYDVLKDERANLESIG